MRKQRGLLWAALLLVLLWRLLFPAAALALRDTLRRIWEEEEP